MTCVLLAQLVLCQGLALIPDLGINFHRVRFLIIDCNDKKIITDSVSREVLRFLY